MLKKAYEISAIQRDPYIPIGSMLQTEDEGEKGGNGEREKRGKGEVAIPSNRVNASN